MKNKKIKAEFKFRFYFLQIHKYIQQYFYDKINNISKNIFGHLFHGKSMSAKKIHHAFNLEERSAFVNFASKGNFEAVKNLLSDGMPINVVNKDGETALIGAIESQHHKITDFLLNSGANVNIKTKRKDTPLIMAARQKDESLLVKLLELNAHPFFSDEQGDTAGHHIIRTFKYSSETQISLISLLLEKGMDINQMSNNGNTLLSTELLFHNISRLKDSTDLMQFLINKGGNYNQFTHAGMQPIHFASKGNRMDALNLLIEKGCDINARDINGNTPVFIANTEAGITNILAHAPDISLVNYDGETVITRRMKLKYKSEDQLTPLIIRLISAGADINQRNAYGENPKEIAGIQKLKSVSELINAIELRHSVNSLIEDHSKQSENSISVKSNRIL